MKPFILALIYCSSFLGGAYLLSRPFIDNPVRMENAGKSEALVARYEFLTACQKHNPLKDCEAVK